MAATIPAHAVVASFRFEDGAGNALHKLKDIAKEQGLGVQNAAVLPAVLRQEAHALRDGVDLLLGPHRDERPGQGPQVHQQDHAPDQ